MEMRSLDHWLCFLVLLALPFCEVQAQYSLRYSMVDSDNVTMPEEINVVDSDAAHDQIIANLGFLTGVLGLNADYYLACGDRLFCCDLLVPEEIGNGRIIHHYVFLGYEIHDDRLVTMDSIHFYFRDQRGVPKYANMEMKRNRLVLSAWKYGGGYWVDFSLDLDEYMKGDIQDFFAEFEAFFYRKVPKNLARERPSCSGRL